MNIKTLIQDAKDISIPYALTKIDPLTFNEQIAHMHSEIGELYQSHRHLEPRERQLSELVDCVLDVFTMAVLMNTDSEELEKAIIKKLREVKLRICLREVRLRLKDSIRDPDIKVDK